MSAAIARDDTESAEVSANDVPLSSTEPFLRAAPPPLHSELKANAQASRERRGHVPMPQAFCSGDLGAGYDSPPIRILAYGDSLTAGYHDRGRQFAPYGKWVVELFAQQPSVEFLVCGLSGLTGEELAEGAESQVISDGAGRKGMGLQAILDSHDAFDLVLIMLGTNDISSHTATSDKIFGHIKKLHLLCHDVGIPTVALSIPDNEFLHVKPVDEDYMSCWRGVNELLRNWASVNDQVPLFIDSGHLVPWKEGSSLWEQDGLHFAPAGSAALGNEIAVRLLEYFNSKATNLG